MTQYSGPGAGQLKMSPFQQYDTREYDNHYDYTEESYIQPDKDHLSLADVQKLNQSVPKPTPKPNQSTISTVTYVHIDSRERIIYPENILDEKIIFLEPYPLLFENGSDKMRIIVPDSECFHIGDRITINNVTSKNLLIQNPLSLKMKSKYIRINQTHHGMSLFGLYDPTDTNQFEIAPYTSDLPPVFTPHDPDRHQNTSFHDDPIPDILTNFVLKKQSNLFVKLSGIKSPTSYIGNIPTNYLNQLLEVTLIFNLVAGVMVLNRNAYLIKLIRTASINYLSTNDTVLINYYNLYGLPINILNAGTPNTVMRQTPYYEISDLNENEITVDLVMNAIIDPFYTFYDDDVINLTGNDRGGGEQIIVQIITEIVPGSPHPNNYLVRLNQNYNNVSQVRIIASMFPNSFKIINLSNNYLYWRNIDDGDSIYYLKVTPGNYSPCELAEIIEELYALIPRLPYVNTANEPLIDSSTLHLFNKNPYDNNGHYKYHDVEVNIDPNSSIVTFYFYRRLKLFDAVTIPNMSLIINGLGEPCQYFIQEKTLYTFSHEISEWSYQVSMDMDTSVIIDFYYEERERVSLNTNTILENFSYDPESFQLILPNHQLQIGTIFYTDLFAELDFYEVIYVIDTDTLLLKIIDTKMIYHDMLLGYDENDIPDIDSIDINEDDNKYMIVTQRNHQFTENTMIEIGDHLLNIIFVMNEDKYVIPLIDDLPDEIVIRYPDFTQLFFNFKNTFGDLLAFRRVGDPLSITPYGSIIRNIDSYGQDFNFSGISQSFEPSDHPLQMTGDSYFYIICPELGMGTYRNTQIYRSDDSVIGLDSVFAKIQITKNPGNYLINSFEPIYKVFPSLTSLNQLRFRFVNPDGTDVNFYDADHNFTLEFTIVNNVPTKSNVDANIDSIVGPRVIDNFN